MTFKANSMTFKIDPSRFPYMPTYALKAEFEEFIRWFIFNVGAMRSDEAENGWKIIADIKSILDERGIDTSALRRAIEVPATAAGPTAYPARW